MSESGRHSYITFGWVATIALALLGGALYHSSYTQMQLSSEYAQKCSEQHREHAVRQPSSDPATNDQKPADDTAHDEPLADWCNLAAQQSVAESSRGTHWAAWTTVLFSGLGAFLLWQTLIATQDTVRETRRIGEAQVRAYVAWSDAIFAAQLDNSKKVAGIRFEARLKNTGQSPARLNAMMSSAYLGFDDKIPPVSFPVATAKCDHSLGSNALFRFREQYLPLVEAISVFDGDKRYYILGWVSYYDVFQKDEDRPHKSHFCYEVKFLSDPRMFDPRTDLEQSITLLNIVNYKFDPQP